MYRQSERSDDVSWSILKSTQSSVLLRPYHHPSPPISLSCTSTSLISKGGRTEDVNRRSPILATTWDIPWQRYLDKADIYYETNITISDQSANVWSSVWIFGSISVHRPIFTRLEESSFSYSREDGNHGLGCFRSKANSRPSAFQVATVLEQSFRLKIPTYEDHLGNNDIKGQLQGRIH